MTAKTILIQLYQKIDNFESINKHLVLVVQDHLIDYIIKEFAFAHINTQPLIGDSMHIHSYKLKKEGKDYEEKDNDEGFIRNNGSSYDGIYRMRTGSSRGRG